MPMMICRRDSSWKRASNRGVVDLLSLNELESSMFHTCYIATYTKEYAAQTADMSLHFGGTSEHCHLTLTQGLQLQKRFWNPQKASKMTPETNMMSHFLKLAMNSSLSFSWIFKLLCNSSYLAIKQLHQNLDLAKIKPKDLAGNPIAKGSWLFMYHICIHI